MIAHFYPACSINAPHISMPGCCIHFFSSKVECMRFANLIPVSLMYDRMHAGRVLRNSKRQTQKPNASGFTRLALSVTLHAP